MLSTTNSDGATVQFRTLFMIGKKSIIKIVYEIMRPNPKCGGDGWRGRQSEVTIGLLSHISTMREISKI